MPKPTLKTIAEISGLAVPTVSRALNDAPDIGQATKQKIRRIAEEIGYVPNRAGVRLRTGRTNVISLVISTEHDLMNVTARMMTSVAGGLRDTPYHLNVTPFFPSEDVLRPIRNIVENRLADGVIFNQIAPNDVRVDYLIDQKFPFATHGRSGRSEEHAWFDFDNEAFVVEGVRHLAGRGRKNIIIVAAPGNHSYGSHMRSGAIIGARETGITVTILDGVHIDAPSDDIRAEVVKTLQNDPTIDGIITGSNSSTMAAVSGLEYCGASVGVEIDVFSKESVTFLGFFRPGIITIREEVAVAGAFLAKATMQAIQMPNDPPMQHLDVPHASAIKSG